MISAVLNKLQKVRQVGAGYMALCPAHDDREPSLSVRLGETGKALFHCHAGCSQSAVMTALGLVNTSIKPISHSRIVATYDYRDEAGELLYQSVRLEPKSFRQRVPEGNKWKWSLNGTRRVLYRLPELLKSDSALPVFIVEGEKDVDRLVGLGAIAVSNPGGAGKWRDEYSEHLKGRNCVILPDNDQVGRDHAIAVAKSLFGKASEVRILRLQGIPEKGDVSDWLDSGNSLDALIGLIDTTRPLTLDDLENPPQYREKREKRTGEAESRKEGTQASRLMGLVEGIELFHTPEREAYATVPVGSHLETYPVKSRAFREWLAHQFWKAESSVPSSQAIQDVVHGLGGRALFEGQTLPVHLRIAELENRLHLDLGNEEWQSVEITADGWTVRDKPKVRFRRTKGTLALPVPEKGGAIELLRKYVNIVEHDWPLLLAWLAAAFRPNRPFPVLVLHGEQGSGKSTTAKVLRSLVDPNKSPLRSTPRDERDLMIAANNSWIVSLDNLSSMSIALSDSLCRLSTGGGFSTRELFSDGEEILLDVMRPVILNGIDEVITRSDLLDRSILLHLPRLEARFDESTFWSDFERERPQIIGAILDAVSDALGSIETVTREVRECELALPRLADFALWGIASESSFGLDCGLFSERYKGNRESVHDLVIDCDPFAESIVRFMSDRRHWNGLPSDLLTAIRPVAGEDLSKLRVFPKSPQAIGKRLALLAPNLREHGIEFIGPDRSKRDRTLTLRRTGNRPGEDIPF